MRKIGAVALCTLSMLVSGPLKAQQPLPNLAYTKDFAVYLSGRLANDLVEVGAKAGAFESDQEGADILRYYEMIYFHLIIECDGPLPQLAEVLRYFVLEPTSGQVGALGYVGLMDSKIARVARAWNAKVIGRVLERLRSGRFLVLPECIDERFVRQNSEFMRPRQ